MTRVLIIGVDSLDADILTRLRGSLPNIERLIASGKQLPVTSTFPPDSDTAWATIYTGTDPAKHGIVRFVDPLEKSHLIQNVGMSNQTIAGRTFWDIAAAAGRRCIALFPHLGYPIWEQPGVVIARDSRTGSVVSRPPDLVKRYPDSELAAGVPGFPRRGANGLRAYLSKLDRLAEMDSDFAVDVIRDETWDLCFAYFSTLDAVSHFAWGYGDPDDARYTPNNPFRDAIRTTYERYDGIVGRLLSAVDATTTVILVSDHGHGARPRTLVNVNEILRREGLLVSRQSATRPQVRLRQSALRAVVRVVTRFDLGRLAGHGLRRFPRLLGLFTKPSAIDWAKTTAYASDMSGIKSYSYGGVIVNRDLVPDQADYELVRTEIIDTVRAHCEVIGPTALKFVARREDLYQGPYLDKYPDILMELDSDYGLGWAVNTSLVTEGSGRSLVPGSHRGDGAIFFVRSPRTFKPDVSLVRLTDVAPTVLDALGCLQGRESSFDGSSVFAPSIS